MKKRSAWVAASFGAAVVAGLAMGANWESGGGAPYTPTQAEWLCVLLNMDEAVANGMQWAMGAGVRYRYDHAQPDTVQIEVLYNANVGEEERRNRAKQARQQVLELAKLKGWDDWLKTTLTETKIGKRPGVRLLDE